MKAIRVRGENTKHKVLVYALSTCPWCKLTKDFLREQGIEYEYIDVDLCSEVDKEAIQRTILSKGGRRTYPTIIIDDNIVVQGLHKAALKEALGI